MHIDDLILASKKYINAQQQEKSELIVGKDWAQGRTAYGGITAALIYTAIKENVTKDRLLRSFTCNFIAPVSCEAHLEIE
ncbi:MAG: acyl-CoA thioesterase, partial [Paraglaciecola sp.]